MYKEITDEDFVKEMKILWQNNISVRELICCMIRDYFNAGDRAEKIIQKMQEKV